MAKQDTKLNELITFGIIILFMVGAIFFYTGDSNETSTVYGDNVIWADFHNTQMDIWTRNIDDIYGIQFEFEGVNFIGVNGGYLKENDFETSHNNKVILSFSFKGKFVPVGEHKLLTLDLSYLNGKHNVSLTNMVIAGAGGKALDFGYYNTIKKVETRRTSL